MPGDKVQLDGAASVSFLLPIGNATNRGRVERVLEDAEPI